jgi:hypothetical protein
MHDSVRSHFSVYLMINVHTGFSSLKSAIQLFSPILRVSFKDILFVVEVKRY